MVQYHHRCFTGPLLRPLKKAVGSANAGAADPLFRAYRIPDIRAGSKVQSFGVSIPRAERPFPYVRQLFQAFLIEQRRCDTGGVLQPRSAEVVPAPLQYCHRRLRSRHRTCDRKILLEELLLEVFRVRGNDGLMSSPYCIEERGDKVAECLPDPRGGFNDQMTPFQQRRGNRRGHLPLLRAQFKPLAARKCAGLREYRLDRIVEVGCHIHGNVTKRASLFQNLSF